MKALVFVPMAVLALAACTRGNDALAGQARQYMLAHPDALRDVVQRYDAKQEEQQLKDAAAEKKAELAAQENARRLLPKLRPALEHDPEDFVANPSGKVTVTEFYDYRCPHCINIALNVLDLIHRRPEVRFVFKEWPIFGATSQYAARVALATQAQHKDYLGVYTALMASRALDQAQIDRIAASEGVDTSIISEPAEKARADAHLKQTTALARQLGIDGTPGFVVGDEIIEGEDVDELEQAIAKAEKKAA
jgi:protein-disulfide isomerase